MKTIERVPLALKIAKNMIRWRIRGGYRLLRVLGELGMLNVIVKYQLDRGVRISVPIFRADTCWDRRDLMDYEMELIGSFCRFLEPLCNVILFDCGADIGTFSALVCSQSSNVARVFAFEPNPDAAKFMKHNLSELGVPSEAYAKAVGAVNGTGRLEMPDYDGSDHGRYLVSGDGPLEVLCIDSLGVRGGDIAIKADVEGGELEVLKGASETISSARKCVIAFEAHPKVTIRTGRDPVECLRFLSTLRKFNFVIAETGQLLSTSSSVITDADTRVFNVIGWTP